MSMTSKNTLHGCDMVSDGCMTAEETNEDVEMRDSILQGSASPNKTSIME
jgi:hypothetical protein